MFTRKSLMYYMLQVSSSTLISRFLGIIRELLQVRYLGVTPLSDAFIIALSIPSSMRKFFAEGALSSAVVPVLVRKMKMEGKDAINRFMSLSLLIFESLVAVFCLFCIYFAAPIMQVLVPGFTTEQIQYGAQFLQILMPFILFISSSALFGGALQASGHFLIPALGPALLNLVYIAGLILCIAFKLPIAVLCWIIVAGALIQCIVHLIVYLSLQFGFGALSETDLPLFKRVFLNFLWSFLAKGVNEIGFYVDKWFASFLASGSVTLIYYANRFMNMPLGIFGVALSTILLPHFARTHTERPQRMVFHITHAIKFILWIMLPIAIIMWLLSQKIFTTLFISEHFSFEHAYQAANILQAFLIGLCFFALNTILVNIYYAIHVTWVPGVVGALTTIINIVGNALLISRWGAVGLAIATSFSALVQTCCLMIVLQKRYRINIPLNRIGIFLMRYCWQLCVTGITFIVLYQSIMHFIYRLPMQWHLFFSEQFGFWLWVGPLIALYFLLLYATRRYFNIYIWYLN